MLKILIYINKLYNDIYIYIYKTIPNIPTPTIDFTIVILVRNKLAFPLPDKKDVCRLLTKLFSIASSPLH